MNNGKLAVDKSLSEVHSSVEVNHTSNFWKRLFFFTGPAFMVSVGYMDPGNWATDLAGGAQFGYKLIWVILLANLMAILFQSLSARLGIVQGRDLAQLATSLKLSVQPWGCICCLVYRCYGALLSLLSMCLF